MQDTTSRWRLVIGSDDAGLSYKEQLLEDLRRDPRVASVEDVGVEPGRDDPVPDRRPRRGANA